MTISANDLSKLAKIDLSDVLGVSNPGLYPFSSILLNKKKSKANDVVVSRRVKTLSKPVGGSGKKKEGQREFDYEKTEYTYVSNNCELFSKPISITATSVAVLGAEGAKKLMSEEILDRAEEIQADFEQAIFNGVKADNPRALGSILTGITLTDLEGGALTLDAIEAELTKLYLSKATKDIFLVCHPTMKAKVDKLILDRERVTINVGTGNVQAGVNVVQFQSHLGFPVTMVVSPAVPETKIVLLDMDKMDAPILRNLSSTPLSKTGDCEDHLITFEGSVIIAPNAIVGITNFI